MRALLIANPKATSTSRRVRDLLFRTFSSNLDLELAETKRRGHATELAAAAAAEGYDVVITVGGDGTVNETVNGLLAGGPRPAGELPALAVLPGGSANVFARAIGLPNDPVRATARVLEALRTGRQRTVGLGQADGRHFTFAAGIGLDAEVVHAVEQARLSGSRADPSLYVRAGLKQFFAVSDRRRPALTLERPGEDPVKGLFLAIVSNSSPWTFLGPRRVVVSPKAGFDSGLDVFATRRLGVVTTASLLVQMMTGGGVRGPVTVNVHDAAEFTVSADRPMAFQLDGDYLGQRESVTFRSVPKAIRIVG